MSPAWAAAPGLCGVCRHRHTITSRRGSTFLLCRKSEDDPRFPKYPPLPVLACAGFEHGPGDDAREL